MDIKKIIEDYYYVLLTLLMAIAAASLLYYAIYKPAPGYECTLTDAQGQKLQGNCTHLYQLYKNGQLPPTLLDINLSPTTSTSSSTTSSTTTPDPFKMTTLYPPILFPPTSTTFKLKHQGNMSSNKATTTSTTTTIPEIKDYMTRCAADSECTLASCCPCEYGGTQYAINKAYKEGWEDSCRTLSMRCGTMKRPCWYTTKCVEGRCSKQLSENY